MATRETFSIRLSSEEKAAVSSQAAAFGMSMGEYSRYCLLNPPTTPPPTTPAYNQLVSQVRTLETTITNLASSDADVAAALTKARAALGPREED